MVLLFAVALGLIAGFLRAKFGSRAYQSVEIKEVWLVFIAYLPQFFAFYLPATRLFFLTAGFPLC